MTEGSDEDNIVSIKEARERAARGVMAGRAALNDDDAVRAQILTIPPAGYFMEVPPGGWEPLEGGFGLPPHCPVVPLGRANNVCYILNAHYEITELKAGSQKKSELELAFGRYTRYLEWAWPRRTKSGDPEPDNFDADKAFKALVMACSWVMDERGPWDHERTLRGRGVWRRSDGGLLVHLGDRLLKPDTGEVLRAGLFDGYLYAKKAKYLTPAKDVPVGDDHGPGQRLYDALCSWNWARPEIDPYLMLGWIGQSFLSGALDWRSVCWLVGKPGSGKSYAQDLAKRILGNLAFTSDNVTAPAIYRGLAGDAGAVILDEQEGGADERKGRAMVELSRQAASGAIVQRAGGANGQVQTFPVRSAFMFGAVSPPGMESADYSRMCLLEMRPRDRSTQGLPQEWLDDEFCRVMGEGLFARMVADFDRVSACIQHYRRALIDRGHSDRGADTFGTLLGCAHVMMDDSPPDEQDAANWAEPLAPDGLAELEFATDGWQDCWDILLTAQPQPFRHLECKSVGALLNQYRENRHVMADGESEQTALDILRKRLNEVGLSLIHQDRSLAYSHALLFVPSTGAAIGQLTHGSDYAGRGKVVTSLRQMPDDWVKRSVTSRVHGRKVKGIGIWLHKIMPEEAI